jgi:hypothetical protein
MAKPTHTLFHVIEGKDGKDNFWLKIGAGWEHKDGDGISLDFEVFPTKTGRVTLRRMKDKEGEEEGPRPDGRGLSHLMRRPRCSGFCRPMRMPGFRRCAAAGRTD